MKSMNDYRDAVMRYFDDNWKILQTMIDKKLDGGITLGDVLKTIENIHNDDRFEHEYYTKFYGTDIYLDMGLPDAQAVSNTIDVLSEISWNLCDDGQVNLVEVTMDSIDGTMTGKKQYVVSTDNACCEKYFCDKIKERIMASVGYWDLKHVRVHVLDASGFMAVLKAIADENNYIFSNGRRSFNDGVLENMMDESETIEF